MTLEGLFSRPQKPVRVTAPGLPMMLSGEGIWDQPCTNSLSDSELGGHKSHYRKLQSRRHGECRTGRVSEKMEEAGRHSRLDLGHQGTEKGQLPSG